jgi:hypothetical protein
MAETSSRGLGVAALSSSADMARGVNNVLVAAKLLTRGETTTPHLEGAVVVKADTQVKAKRKENSRRRAIVVVEE